MFSIIPQIVKNRGIEFFDEREIPFDICEQTEENYVIPFSPPFLVIDTFAKKEIKEEKVVLIDIEELKKLGFNIVVITIKSGTGWYNRQRVMYILENSQNRRPGARKLSYVPEGHKVQKDTANKRIRICGANSGYPHHNNKEGGAGPWVDFK